MEFLDISQHMIIISFVNKSKIFDLSNYDTANDRFFYSENMLCFVPLIVKPNITSLLTNYKYLKYVLQNVVLQFNLDQPM